MDIDGMTIVDFKKLFCLLNVDKDVNGPWVIGEKYLIRTVTQYATGRLISIGKYELLLEDAAWIADTGRFSKALKTGELSEVEPVGKMIIGRGSIVDAELWCHELPEETK